MAGLSNAARITVGIVLFIVTSSMIFSLSIYCNRRNRRTDLATGQQTQRGSGAAYGRSPHGSGPADDLAPPQYPPPAHNPFDDPYIYDLTTGFAPPSVPPPQYYLPPPGEPPIISDQKSAV